MSVTVVLPSVDPEYTQACIRTMRFADLETVPQLFDPHRPATDIAVVNGHTWTDGRPDVRLVVIYNTPRHNLGVAGSWNVGVREMFDQQHDWLVLLSAGVRFGPTGGQDFVQLLLDGPDCMHPGWPRAIEAADGLGWHLLAFHRSVFERVGYFDENYHPAYFEDLDMSHRIQLAYGIDSRAPGFVGPLWPKVWVDAQLVEVAHGIKRGGVHVDLEALERYHQDKWGGRAQHETYTTPFNSGNPVSWWPEPQRTSR